THDGGHPGRPAGRIGQRPRPRHLGRRRALPGAAHRFRSWAPARRGDATDRRAHRGEDARVPRRTARERARAQHRVAGGGPTNVTTALQRTVLVVCRNLTEAPRLYPADVDGSMAVVIITVGWPMTAAQSSAVDQALELARERRVVFDAFLVGSIAESLDVVDARDRVL